LTSRISGRAAGIGLLLLASSCSQIFGIDDAHVDPLLAEGTGGASGKSSGGTAGDTGGTSAESGGSSSTSGGSSSGGSSGTSGSSTGGSSTGGDGGTSGSAQGGANNGGGPVNTAGDGGTGEEPVALCERYCEAVMTNCKGRYEQYRNFEQCMGTCTALPAGSPDDQNVNTVECRLRQADFAEAEPFLYCKSSGPLGAGKCGSNCISYCSLMMSTCTAESTEIVTEAAYFESNEACLADCSAIVPAEGAPTEYTTSSTVEPVSFVGNHVYCRTYHIASAIAEAAPDEHCPHAMGADPCIDP
jgi:hypothetical protein